MDKKGMSLAVETVVVIILAAVVLGALLFFFNKNVNPVMNTIDDLKKQTTLCQKYLALDPTCRQSEYLKNPDLKSTASSLKEVCVKNAAFEPYCKTNPKNIPPTMTSTPEFYCVAKCCASYGCSGAL